jgi:hypothetical protein
MVTITQKGCFDTTHMGGMALRRRADTLPCVTDVQTQSG